MRHVGTQERRAVLAERHRLRPHLRTDDVVSIADALVALHSSDPATVFLSVLARMENPSVEALETALYVERSLLRYHAMRRTIWVANPETVAAMNASSTRKIAAVERRKLIKFLGATEGIDDPESELRHLETEVMEAVHQAGSITTRQLGNQRPDLTRKVTIGSGAHIAEVGAHTRITSLAGFEGRLIRGRPKGSWVASEYSWHIADDWCSIDFDALDERDATATLLRAYLSRFGPATETDLRWWTGWTAAAVRNALADLSAVEVCLDGGMAGWLLPSDPLLDGINVDDEPWVAVLPSLDPTTMGWKERAWYLDDDTTARVFDRNANAGPTIWCNGEVVGGWVQHPSGELAVELVHPLSTDAQVLLYAELERLREAIGETRFRVRFPSPNQKYLLE